MLNMLHKSPGTLFKHFASFNHAQSNTESEVSALNDLDYYV